MHELEYSVFLFYAKPEDRTGQGKADGRQQEAGGRVCKGEGWGGAADEGGVKRRPASEECEQAHCRLGAKETKVGIFKLLKIRQTAYGLKKSKFLKRK